MAWLKWHVGSSSDPKFRVIAKHAKVKISDAIAVWLMILEHAFEHDGSIESLNKEIIEAVLNIRLEKIDAVLTSMRELSMLDDVQVINWDKRQASQQSADKKEKSAMSGAERQRRYKERKRAENDALVTDNDEPVTKSDETADAVVTKNDAVVTEVTVVTKSDETGDETVTKNDAPLKEKIKIKEEDKDKEIKNSFCAEQSCDSSTPPPQLPVLISLPLNDKTEFPVTCEQTDKWQELYPAVNVPQQLRNMRGWLDANPTKRKTKSGICRFINSWLAKEQNKGGYSRASPLPGNQPSANTEYQRNMQDRRMMATMILAQRQKEKNEHSGLSARQTDNIIDCVPVRSVA